MKNFSIYQNQQISLLQRSKDGHKGTFGHLALIAGSIGMAGAAILSAQAAQRSGVGIVTVFGPETNRTILQGSVHEAMYSTDLSEENIIFLKENQKITAFAIGPGLGQSDETVQILKHLLSELNTPLVLDADALNILAKNPFLWKFVPKKTIITPHPKEFERLFGITKNFEKMIELASRKAVELQINIILKGANTRIIHPSGEIHINSTGNSGMATGGSGDVLTGILGSLLAQGYPPEQATHTGVFLHGLAADIALETESEESLIAGDIIKNLGRAFKMIASKNINK